MQLPEIQERIRNGEDSTTQFKRDVTDANRLAEEMVAFANAQGGVLLIGVDDDGLVSGLDDAQISRLNQLISNTASENVKPPIYPLTELLEIQGKRLMVVNIRRGGSPPLPDQQRHLFHQVRQ
ncbi:MAG: ATP-binding protein [Thiolinea sp.]